MNNRGPIDRLDKKLFRFAVVSQVITAMTAGQRCSDAVAAATALQHPDGAGRTRRVSRRSVYRWLAAYQEHGIAGLVDPPRSPRPEKIDETLIAFLVAEVEADREASLPELIERARQRGVLPFHTAIDRSTAYRALRRRGVILIRARKRRGRDSRRFAFPHRMDMVMCDGKHFRVGEKRLRRVALFYLDDASRKVLVVVIGTAESTRLFLRGLKLCIQKYGRMSTIYMDHGPGFDSNATREVVANLDDVHLVLGEVGYPQGRGKVERFNQTIDQDVLRKLDKNPDCDPDLGSLEIRLQHYIDQVYGERPHRGLGQLTPNQRFHEDTRALRFVEDSSAFDDAFVVKHRRRVSHDHVISLGGESYEVPRGYAGHKIVVIRQILEDAAVLFDHDGKRIQLHPVDRVRNAHGKRAKPNIKLADNRRASPGDSAAGARFVRDHAPLVDGDGGYRSTDVGLDDLDPSGDDPGDPTDHDDIPF